MKLSENRELFKELIEAVSTDTGLVEIQIEKDYMVSLLLKRISLIKNLGIVFKGGTSLSKCYNVINRFSEDIDIAIQFENGKITQVERKLLKIEIIKAIYDIGLKLINIDEIRSGRDFNRYIVTYPKISDDISTIDPNIIIETIVAYQPYPCEQKFVSNFILKYLEKIVSHQLITQYNLEPFEMTVQSIDRTFVDKLYAICDYHLEHKYTRFSRHIYDIHMIWESSILDKSILKELALSVAKDRQKFGSKNLSCLPNSHPHEIIKSIIDENVYRNDFNDLTAFMIYDDINYETCIKTLEIVASNDILPEIIENYTIII